MGSRRDRSRRRAIASIATTGSGQSLNRALVAPATRVALAVRGLAASVQGDGLSRFIATRETAPCQCPSASSSRRSSSANSASSTSNKADSVDSGKWHGSILSWRDYEDVRTTGRQSAICLPRHRWFRGSSRVGSTFVPALGPRRRRHVVETVTAPREFWQRGPPASACSLSPPRPSLLPSPGSSATA